jgi:hypothetical protein
VYGGCPPVRDGLMTWEFLIDSKGTTEETTADAQVQLGMSTMPWAWLPTREWCYSSVGGTLLGEGVVGGAQRSKWGKVPHGNVDLMRPDPDPIRRARTQW